MNVRDKGFMAEEQGRADAEQQVNDDSELLDFIQAQTKGYGGGWLFRDSTRGRGMRLHETTRDGAVADVREAIRSEKRRVEGSTRPADDLRRSSA